MITQQMTSYLLDDEAFMTDFITLNQRSLKRSYSLLSSACAEANLPIVPATSSIFAFIDLRSLMRKPVSSDRNGDKEATYHDEMELFNSLCDRYIFSLLFNSTHFHYDFSRGVVLTPGSCCHCPAPGFFRVCYAYVPYEVLAVAVERIVAFAKESTK